MKLRKLAELVAVRLLGHHHYRVKFAYKVDGQELWNVILTAGVPSQRCINEPRLLKRHCMGRVDKLNGVSKHLLRNGSVEVEPVCYLGRWRR